MSVAYILGVFCGLALVAIVCAILAHEKRQQGIKNWYDERQQMARNQAFKYAFFTLIAFDVVNAIVIDVFDILWSDATVAALIGVCLSLGVFACTCIWKEAYLSLSDQPKRLAPLVAIGTIVNLLIGAVNIYTYGLFDEAGLLTYHSSNFIIGIMCLFILINFLIWTRRHNAEETE